MFSNELARRFDEQGIVSISLYPGAVNADFAGAAGSFLTRIRKMVAALICFLIQGGDLDAVTDDVRHVRSSTFDYDSPSVGRSSRPTANNHPMASNHPVATMGNLSAQAQEDPLGAMSTARDHLAELSGASCRAITSLYAGTDPAAGQLNGRVRYPVSGLVVTSGISTYHMYKNFSLQYLTAWARRTLPHRKALDRDLAARLWTWCEDQVRDRELVREEVPVQAEPVRAEEPAKEEPVKEKVKEEESVKEKEPVEEPTKVEEPAKVEEPIKVEEPVKEKEQPKGEDVKANE